MSAQAPEDAPILCETCLGPNPFIRMTKEPFGKACKICERPFMIYRWKPADGRYKKTEICPTCAKIKNVCQTCVLDLQFGLPVQVRDTILDEDEKTKAPVSDVNRLWGVEAHERQLDTNAGDATYVKAAANAPAVLKSLRSGATPYYKRNQAKICSFFVSGRCNRGDTCPYRHEMPVQGELANQNIRDRYYGKNDPVANKLLGRLNKQTRPPETPADPTLTTLWLGNLDKDTSDGDIRSFFSKFGDISNIHVVPAKNCAFLTFTLRSAAEDAAANSWGQCVIRGSDVRVNWGKRQQSAGGLAPPPGMGGGSSIPDLPPPPGMGSVAYPSMDPKNMNARIV